MPQRVRWNSCRASMQRMMQHIEIEADLFFVFFRLIWKMAFPTWFVWLFFIYLDLFLDFCLTCEGDNEFLGCAPPLAVSGIQSLGFTLQNGFWNKWQFFTVLDINLDGIKGVYLMWIDFNQFSFFWLLDFFYQDTAGELGYIIFHSAFVWKQYPALDAIHNKNQYCANPKPYAFDSMLALSLCFLCAYA